MPNISILNTSIRNLDNLYCLNDLHKAAGNEKRHKPGYFTQIDQTKELIQEITRGRDIGLAIKTKRGGTNQGTYVCKELVYAYAMWISPRFSLIVIRAFDAMNNQQELPLSQVPTAMIDADKYQLLNNIIRSMGFKSDPVVVPGIDIVHLIQAIRNYQHKLSALTVTPDWENETIERVKGLTGRHFLDQKH